MFQRVLKRFLFLGLLSFLGLELLGFWDDDAYLDPQQSKVKKAAISLEDLLSEYLYDEGNYNRTAELSWFSTTCWKKWLKGPRCECGKLPLEQNFYRQTPNYIPLLRASNGHGSSIADDSTSTSRLVNHIQDSLQTLLIIGVSHDCFVFDQVCLALNGTVQYVPHNPVHVPYEDRLPRVCLRSDQQQQLPTVAFFNIFGMARACSNGGMAQRTDRRHYNTTAERIKELLPELLAILPRPVSHVQLGSSLWDLSHGCNDQIGVPVAFQQDYASGVVRNVEVLRQLLPNAQICLRTGFPLTPSYSQNALNSRRGRNNPNQKVLNQILNDTLMTTLQPAHDVHLLDLWSVVEQQPASSQNSCSDDGVHFNMCYYVLFFNAWIHQILTAQ